MSVLEASLRESCLVEEEDDEDETFASPCSCSLFSSSASSFSAATLLVDSFVFPPSGTAPPAVAILSDKRSDVVIADAVWSFEREEDDDDKDDDDDEGEIIEERVSMILLSAESCSVGDVDVRKVIV